MVRVPPRVPETVGLNVTLSVQLEPDCSCAGQSLVCAKSPATWMLLRFNAALPLLVRVALCGVLEVPTCWPGKTRLLGVTVAMGAGAEPVPVRFTVWGLP